MSTQPHFVVEFEGQPIAAFAQAKRIDVQSGALARVAQLSLVHGFDNVPDAANEDALRHWLRQMIAFAVEERRPELGAAAVVCARAFGLHVQQPQAYPHASEDLKRTIWRTT